MYDFCGMHQPIEDYSDLMPELFRHGHGMASSMDWVPAPKQETAQQPTVPLAPSPKEEPCSAGNALGASRRRKAAPKSLRPQQIAIIELQKQVDQLMKEHDVVATENSRLKARLRVIEAVLPVRERQERLAQAAGLSSRAAAEPEPPVLASLLDLQAPSPSSSCTTSTCPSGTDADDTASPQDPNSSMGFDSLGRSYSGATSLAAASSGATGPTCTPSGTASGGQRCAPDSARRQQHKVQQQQQQAEDEARWQQAWQTWVREAALLVHAHDARPNELYEKRVEDAFARLKAAAVYGCAKHPELICNMRQVNMETGVEEVPPDSFWTLVASGMRLTPAQVADCRTALTLYRERMEVVMAERRSLADQLSSCMGALHLAEAEGRAAPGSTQRDKLSLRVEEVAAALDTNVAAEGHTTRLARDMLNSTLFTKMQCARISVLSYPYFPDALALLTAAVDGAERPAKSGGCSNAAGDTAATS
ncbi:hypothetical protein HXX76_005237 [Chlamydomonas incerta]|uniref:Uncharacterized protein n=1 Tax=Chlamydomonas incerta TaxID=51695 RepID=A0A835T761_CHLIN|nr:hypothetical protein HXX76_005237 [Chlamydomonas incerta]|eukprot:KAG2438691.1 hypothetical protein HXX76_005237 [Chlamydomonas incerta]